MTTTLPHRLAEPGLRRNITAVLRRKVSSADVEDLTQTALCEALASANLPEEPDELHRFVLAIARHKAVDHHRRQGRALTVVGVETPEPAVPSDGEAIEARALLARIVDDVANDHRERETLGWLVREHDGEALADIAKTEAVEAPAVRQRVSRLRRVLRARWASALLVVLGLGGIGALVEQARETRREAILVDPATDPVAHAFGSVQGTWRVTSLTRTDGGKAVDGVVTLRIDGSRVAITGPLGPVGRVTGTLGKLQPGGDGSFAFRFVDDRGETTSGVARVQGETMHLDLTGGRVRGTGRAAKD